MVEVTVTIKKTWDEPYNKLPPEAVVWLYDLITQVGGVDNIVSIFVHEESGGKGRK